MQVAPWATGGQICNQSKQLHLVAKIVTNGWSYEASYGRKIDFVPIFSIFQILKVVPFGAKNATNASGAMWLLI